MAIAINQKKQVINKKNLAEIDNETTTLLKKIGEIEDRIDTANNIFDYALDPELIDGCIYELNALYQKHSYYLKICKDRGIVSKDLISAEKRDYNY